MTEFLPLRERASGGVRNWSLEGVVAPLLPYPLLPSNRPKKISKMVNDKFLSYHADGQIEYGKNMTSLAEININPIYTVSTKKVSQMFFATTLKLYTNVYQIWKVAAANNAEQCLLKLLTSPGLCIDTTL